jgi:hypothetical protein
MKKLTRRIEERLAVRKFCAVFESELSRIWPATLPREQRKEAIKRFAKEHNLCVTIYDPGLRAVFKKSGKER